MGSEHLVVGTVAGDVEKPAGGRGPGWAAVGGPACFGKGSEPPGLPLRTGILQGGGRTTATKKGARGLWGMGRCRVRGQSQGWELLIWAGGQE